MTPILETRGITKQFPGVLANDHVDFTLEPGEIHTLLGENGAGKTTLMNILYGLYRPDEGEISVKGQSVTLHDPNDAIKLGIGMVHQHFMLIPVFTVAENVMLGVETVHAGHLDQASVAARIEDISRRYGLQVNPKTYVSDLPVGLQQRVEIVKVLYREADILIFDEPSAVLTPQEVDELFVVLRNLKAQGKSIIFISHKLKEVMEISDCITVMRDGKVIGTTTPAQTSQAELARMMVGRSVLLKVDKGTAHPGEPVLRTHDLQVQDERGVVVVNGVDLEVHAGEVLGIAGVQGNGQTELVEALTGLRPLKAGSIDMHGHQWSHATPRQIIEAGTAHVPEDRQRMGLVLQYPVAQNLVLSTYYRPPFAHGIATDGQAVAENAERLVQEFDVRTPSPWVTTSTLSGGNQQKVIIAREFSRPVKLLIASQPTRGLDVGSIEYIHRKIVEMRDQGCGVLLVSAELDEIMALADRIMVMYKGRALATLLAAEATREQLGLLMAGVTEAADVSRLSPG